MVKQMKLLKQAHHLSLLKRDEVDSETDKGSVVGKLETSEKKWDDGDVIIGAAKTQCTS